LYIPTCTRIPQCVAQCRLDPGLPSGNTVTSHGQAANRRGIGMTIQTIDWLQLCLGALLVLIPIGLLGYYRTGLVRDAVIALCRMVLQLLLIGFYLGYLFTLDHPGLNVGWVVLMAAVAATSSLRRNQLAWRTFWLPIFSGMLVGVFFVGTYMLAIVLTLPNPWTARYLIPISGMILGNTLQVSIIGFRTYTKLILDDRERYSYYLSCGATRREALQPFISEALQSALSPMIATMTTIGLVQLPGMMTGQILGGSPPMEAIRYQIMILAAIFVSSSMAFLIALLLANQLIFDSYHNPQAERIKAH
ncbi:MAG: iron export ABC transporter permease subunit FetB, partial [Leptospiraceae bacterium]|nr:iron export ABC transporter permease subunit FetB [Leptospiraceae bacterium]